MSRKLCLHSGHIGLISLLVFRIAFVGSFAKANCSNPPNSTIDTVHISSLLPSTLANIGYRVTNIRSDSVLGQTWATISNCSRPDWPEFALPVSGKGWTSKSQEAPPPSIDHAKAAPVVHAGDIVQLWKQETILRIETLGVSEGNGGLGETIRVRPLRKSAGGQSEPEDLSGVVRGPSNVEIQR
jgi:hypothetical protein